MAQTKVVSKNKFNKKMVRKFNTRYILTHSFFMYFISALGIYAFITLLTQKEVNKESFSYVLCWSLAIIGILFVPLYILFSVTRATKKEEKTNKDVIDTYEVTKEKIVKYDSRDLNKIVLNWNLIAKVVETNDAFYFSTVNDAAFLIPKESIVEGSTETLRALINKCLPMGKNGKVPYTINDKQYKLEQKEIKKKAKEEKKRKKEGTNNDTK